MRSAVEEKDVLDVRLERGGDPVQSLLLLWCGAVLTSLSGDAGDVSGRFLVVRGQAFIVLSSLAVLLPSLSPSGTVPDNNSDELTVTHCNSWLGTKYITMPARTAWPTLRNWL